MSDYEVKYITGISGTKRCDLVHTPWMGDWFTSWSPRNGNNNAEGPWDHWVQLAIDILKHPATGIVRPEAYEAVQGLTNTKFYTGVGRELTSEELAKTI